MAGHAFEPKAALTTPGSLGLCFITPRSLHAVQARLASFGWPVEEGPVR